LYVYNLKNGIHSNKPHLTKGSVHIIEEVIGTDYIKLKTYPGINLYQSRFQIADPEYNPVIYKIREMQERFEKRGV